MTAGNPFLAECVSHSEMREDITQAEVRWQKRFPPFERMLKLTENLSGSHTHLDFGCGFGTFAKLVADRYPSVQVYGIDPDRAKIETGKKRYTSPNLHLSCSEEIEGRYDSVTAVLALHETSDPKKSILDLAQHANPRGRLMVYEFRKTGKKKYREWYEKGSRDRPFDEAYEKHSRWTVDQFRQICENVGFKSVEARPIGDYWLLYIGLKEDTLP